MSKDELNAKIFEEISRRRTAQKSLGIHVWDDVLSFRVEMSYFKDHIFKTPEWANKLDITKRSLLYLGILIGMDYMIGENIIDEHAPERAEE